jgi:hypothetical protein
MRPLSTVTVPGQAETQGDYINRAIWENFVNFADYLDFAESRDWIIPIPSALLESGLPSLAASWHSQV